jgi:cytidylate kinase
MSVYPQGIGLYLAKNSFLAENLNVLKSKLDKNLIFRVFGLAGVGKGTLSEMLSETLEIPHIESGLIIRCATFIYQDLKLELTDENTDLVFAKMEILADKELSFFYNNQKIAKSELKKPIIDENVTYYSSNLYLRKKFDDALDNLIQNTIQTACVADGRGSAEPYLLNAEDTGKTVIRLLLDTDINIKAERYYQHFVRQEKLKNPDYKENPEEKNRILTEFQTTILARDQKDIDNIISKNLGLISKDTAVVNTSFMTPQEVLETVLNYIDFRIEIQKK